MPRALPVGRFDGHERDDALAVWRDVITPKTTRGATEQFIGPNPRGSCILLQARKLKMEIPLNPLREFIGKD